MEEIGGTSSTFLSFLFCFPVLTCNWIPIASHSVTCVCVCVCCRLMLDLIDRWGPGSTVQYSTVRAAVTNESKQALLLVDCWYGWKCTSLILIWSKNWIDDHRCDSDGAHARFVIAWPWQSQPTMIFLSKTGGGPILKERAPSAMRAWLLHCLRYLVSSFVW